MVQRGEGGRPAAEMRVRERDAGGPRPRSSCLRLHSAFFSIKPTSPSPPTPPQTALNHAQGRQGRQGPRRGRQEEAGGARQDGAPAQGGERGEGERKRRDATARGRWHVGRERTRARPSRRRRPWAGPCCPQPPRPTPTDHALGIQLPIAPGVGEPARGYVARERVTSRGAARREKDPGRRPALFFSFFSHAFSSPPHDRTPPPTTRPPRTTPSLRAWLPARRRPTGCVGLAEGGGRAEGEGGRGLLGSSTQRRWALLRMWGAGGAGAFPPARPARRLGAWPREFWGLERASGSRSGRGGPPCRAPTGKEGASPARRGRRRRGPPAAGGRQPGGVHTFFFRLRRLFARSSHAIAPPPFATRDRHHCHPLAGHGPLQGLPTPLPPSLTHTPLSLSFASHS